MLDLEVAVQQDGQEFMKLLLSQVERLLGGSQQPAVRSVVKRLFGGSSAWVTQCQACKTFARSSRNMQDFNELEVLVSTAWSAC